MEITQLKKIIKESVREVIEEERKNLVDILIPFVSDEEMSFLKKKLKNPKDYKEFEDVTDMILHDED